MKIGDYQDAWLARRQIPIYPRDGDRIVTIFTLKSPLASAHIINKSMNQ
jgi:hypothetical protein